MARDWETIYAERTEAAKAKLDEIRLAALAPATQAKAATGPGAFAMTYHTPLHSLSRDPHRLMAEAQALFRTSGWVNAAEHTLGGRFLSMDWHLEDEDGKTIDEKSADVYQEPLRLLQRPSKGRLRSDVMGVTFRHVGLCGNAMWFLDERDVAADTPLSVIYINPARMTPATDAAGNVTGWVLDHPENPVVNRYLNGQQGEGVPLRTEEVIHFTFSEPDWGVWGIGIAEAAQRKIELDKLADIHAGGVLGSGGRLSGLVSPKTGAGAVTDDQWVQFVRDWRSITSDPDAAKRLQIAKMPLDFQQMTASLKELQFTELVKEGRDTIFGIWGVPLTQRGMTVPGGLNADLAEGYKEVTWETVKERSEPLRETIQVKLLDRWEAKGIKVTLVFDYPEFDDRSPLYEAATKSTSVALTNDERRAILGLEPLEDALLGRAVYIDGKLTRIDEIAEAPEPSPILPPMATEDEEDVIGKADLRKPLLGLRQRTETAWEPKVRRVVAGVLGEQHKLVSSKLEHALRKNDLSWWNETRERKRFMNALDPVLVDLAREVAQQTSRLAKKPDGKADGFIERVLNTIRSTVGARIIGINATTREKVQAAIAEGVKVGEGPADIGRRLQEGAAFDEYRAELISRTETAQVYNDAALRSYGALEVTEVQAIDGDEDAECAARNGKVFPIDEAYGIADHPNGTLDWIPVIPEPTAKAASASDGVHIHLPESWAHSVEIPTPQVTVNVPDFPTIPAPIVNVPEAVVNVHPTPVTVEAPIVNVPEAKATLPQEVRVISMPRRIHEVLRRDGEVTGSTEEDDE